MNANRVAAAAVIAIAAVLFAATFWFEQMPEGITRGFGAEAFPRLVLGVIAALAVFLSVVSKGSDSLPRIPSMVYYSGAALLVFMALVLLTGMLPAMFLFMLGLGYLWGERRHARLFITSAVVTGLIWLIFVRGFGVQLPKGLAA